jgi:hypothetical protein
MKLYTCFVAYHEGITIYIGITILLVFVTKYMHCTCS